MEDELKKYIEDRLEEVMPWIGLCIASSSAVCTLAMAADLFNGFRHKKPWFPCNYFSLNAASLTLLAVAMKLPSDLTTVMTNRVDWLAKLSSLIFMSTALINFLSSLGSMSNQDTLSNVVALGILVCTIDVSVWMQLMKLSRPAFIPVLGIMEVLMLFLLAIFVSLGVMAPAMKRKLESKYLKQHKAAVRGRGALEKGERRNDEILGDGRN